MKTLEELAEKPLFVQVPFEQWSQAQGIVHGFKELMENHTKLIYEAFRHRNLTLERDVQIWRENYINLERGYDRLQQELASKVSELAGAKSAEPRWVRCSESLPEIGTDILFYDSQDNEIRKGRSFEVGRVDNIRVFASGDIVRGSTVTHWQPLPSPPSDGGE